MACDAFFLAKFSVDIVAEGPSTFMTLLPPSIWAQSFRTVVKEILTANVVKSDVCLLITFVVTTTLYIYCVK